MEGGPRSLDVATFAAAVPVSLTTATSTVGSSCASQLRALKWHTGAWCSTPLRPRRSAGWEQCRRYQCILSYTCMKKLLFAATIAL